MLVPTAPEESGQGAAIRRKLIDNERETERLTAACAVLEDGAGERRRALEARLDRLDRAAEARIRQLTRQALARRLRRRMLALTQHHDQTEETHETD